MSLKPCPFRHKQTQSLRVECLTYENIPSRATPPEEFFVKCGDCGAQGPVKNSKKAAENAWNRGRCPERRQVKL